MLRVSLICHLESHKNCITWLGLKQLFCWSPFFSDHCRCDSHRQTTEARFAHDCSTAWCAELFYSRMILWCQWSGGGWLSMHMQCSFYCALGLCVDSTPMSTWMHDVCARVHPLDKCSCDRSVSYMCPHTKICSYFGSSGGVSDPAVERIIPHKTTCCKNSWLTWRTNGLSFMQKH